MRGIIYIGLLAGLTSAKLEDPNLHWHEREKIIQEINNKQSTWTAHHNPRFYNQPIGIAKNLCGAKKMPREMLKTLPDVNIININKTFEELGLPDEFDSATNWPQCADVINDIRDQSNCGCCWAFGAAEAASDRLCIATNAKIKVPLSSQDMCFCAEEDGCNGGMLYTAWERIKSDGLVTGGQYQNTGPFGSGWCSAFELPHCHHHGPQGNDPYPDEGQPGCPSVTSSPPCPQSCDSDAVSPHNDFDNDKYGFSGTISFLQSASAIAKSIYEGGPVETAFTVYSDFENYASGVYQHTSGTILGGHAVRIVGWGSDNGVDYWKVANSWNPYWGEDGYFRIVRGDDDCGIESGAMAAASNAEWGKL